MLLDVSSALSHLFIYHVRVHIHLGQTVLHLACARSLDPPIGVLRLLDARAQVNEIDEFGPETRRSSAGLDEVDHVGSLRTGWVCEWVYLWGGEEGVLDVSHCSTTSPERIFLGPILGFG